MRLIDRLIGVERAGYNESMASGAAVLMTTFGTPDEERVLPTFQNAVNAYNSSAVVFGVILARLMVFSEAEFKFQNLTDRSLFGNQALEKLENPWPGATTGELLARMEQDVSLAGNAFIRDAGTQLERLRPDWVTIVSELVQDPISDTEIRRVIGYLYCPPATEERESAFYPVDEVAHWSPIPDPQASFRGMSWLSTVLREIDADVAMTDYKRAYLSNAATPNLLIKYSQKVTPDKIERLREQINARHSGVHNAFRTMILDEGADHAVLGNSLKDMNFDAVQSAGENRIAVASGVPAIVAGLKEGLEAATYSNYGLALRRFVDITERPLWRSACASLAKLVQVPDGARLWYDVSAIAALREGDKERAETMAVLATAASSLINAGYSPESVKAALSASDVTLLDHTGLVSVQLQAPGSQVKELANPKPGDITAGTAAKNPSQEAVA